MIRRTYAGDVLCRLTGIVFAGFVLLAYACCAELPMPERVVLSNGLTVIYQYNPVGQTFGIAAVVGAVDGCETSRTAGLRAVTLEMMTHRLADEEGFTPRERISSAGAVVGTSIDADLLSVHVVGLAENFGKCISAVREIIFGSEFDWSALEIARAGLEHELAAQNDDVVAYAKRLGRNYLLAGTSSAWPAAGTELSLAQLTPARVRRFHRDFVRPGNIVLSISGPMERDAVIGLISREFGAILPKSPIEMPYMGLSDRESIFIHRPWSGPNAVLMMMCHGPAVGHSTVAATDVLCALLGGGEGSRLWRRLRGDLALVYSVGCHRTISSHCATIELLTICRASDAGQVYSVLREELAHVQAALPAEKDLQRAKRWLIGRYLFGHQNNLEAAISVGADELLMPGSGASSGQNLLDAYEHVTAQEVQQAAVKWMSPAAWVQVNGLPPRR